MSRVAICRPTKPSLRYEASGAKRLLLTHRPKELALDGGLEQAHDGLQLDV